jgi:hypothetical protein
VSYIEGIYAKIIPLKKTHNYAFSFFLSSTIIPGYGNGPSTLTFKVVLTNCQDIIFNYRRTTRYLLCIFCPNGCYRMDPSSCSFYSRK